MEFKKIIEICFNLINKGINGIAQQVANIQDKIYKTLAVI